MHGVCFREFYFRMLLYKIHIYIYKNFQECNESETTRRTVSLYIAPARYLLEEALQQKGFITL